MCVDAGGGCGDGGGFRAMRAWLTRSSENIILRFVFCEFGSPFYSCF